MLCLSFFKPSFIEKGEEDKSSSPFQQQALIKLHTSREKFTPYDKFVVVNFSLGLFTPSFLSRLHNGTQIDANS